MANKTTLPNADLRLLKTIFVTQEQFEEGKQEIMDQQQQFRNEFFDKIDPILKEVMDNRVERELMAAKLAEHTDEIETIKRKLNN